ncbi:MAG: hypothetical protein IT379_08530 [Deltaproteobacteria bacterium]|nr:hypothetical protein [Deltaproteobacteria bacterium]
MMLPQSLLSILRTATVSGGLALAAGCTMSAAPAAQTTVYPDGTQVVYLPPDGPGSAPVQVANQPSPYVPGQQATPPPPPNAPRPVATPEPAPPEQPTPSFHDPCPPCGMG